MATGTGISQRDSRGPETLPRLLPLRAGNFSLPPGRSVATAPGLAEPALPRPMRATGTSSGPTPPTRIPKIPKIPIRIRISASSSNNSKDPRGKVTLSSSPRATTICTTASSTVPTGSEKQLPPPLLYSYLDVFLSKRYFSFTFFCAFVSPISVVLVGFIRHVALIKYLKG